MFAIIRTLEFYRNIIQGFCIEIYTDNKNCIYGNKIISKRIERWKLILNEFDLNIKSISGDNNKIADKLSRCFIINSVNNTLLFNKIKHFLVKKSADEYAKDDKNRLIVKKKS
ncbi:Retrovirus-related Pol polyprotein from transposon 17.6 [Dictyocoela muelleri]|nr:Retrovirus-related Pol polyprotein from transposon 17.6 [Dictyocoela muelleri]